MGESGFNQGHKQRTGLEHYILSQLMNKMLPFCDHSYFNVISHSLHV